MENDLQLKRWLEDRGRPYLVVATKIDKLNQSEQEHGITQYPPGRRGAAAVLGRNRPGSEGNLASNHEDTPSTVGNAPPQEKPTEKPAAATAPPAHETSAGDGAGNLTSEAAPDKTEAAERPVKQHSERAPKAAVVAAPPKPESEVKPTDGKPAEAKPADDEAGRDQTAEAAALRHASQRHRSRSAAAQAVPRRTPRTARPRSTWSNSRT